MWVKTYLSRKMIHVWYQHRYYFTMGILTLCEQNNNTFINFLVGVNEHLTKQLENRKFVCLVFVWLFFIHCELPLFTIEKIWWEKLEELDQIVPTNRRQRNECWFKTGFFLFSILLNLRPQPTDNMTHRQDASSFFS